MNERREPTISGLRVDTEEASRPQRAKPQTSAQASAQARAASRPAVRVKTAPQKLSMLAAFALLVALGACAGAGYLFQQVQLADARALASEQRLELLESQLALTGDESSASSAAMQVKLKWADSEIRKLWAIANERNKKNISSNKNSATKALALATETKKRIAGLGNVSTELKIVSDLVDAQQGSLIRIEKENVKLSAQKRALNEKIAKLERSVTQMTQRVSDSEKDIEAINGFRRSVNQQLLELKQAP